MDFFPEEMRELRRAGTHWAVVGKPARPWLRTGVVDEVEEHANLSHRSVGCTWER